MRTLARLTASLIAVIAATLALAAPANAAPLDNPTFDTGIANWNPGSGSVASWDSTDGHNAAGSMLLTSGYTTSDGTPFSTMVGLTYSYAAHAWVKTDVATYVTMAIIVAPKTGAPLSTSSKGVLIQAGVWTEVVVASPLTSSKGNIVKVQFQTGGAPMKADDVSVLQLPGPNYSPGN